MTHIISTVWSVLAKKPPVLVSDSEKDVLVASFPEEERELMFCFCEWVP